MPDLTQPLAHPGAPLAPHDVWLAWNMSPAVLVTLGLMAWLYWRGLRTQSGHRDQAPIRTWAFVAGWLALFVALVSPLDRLAGTLFSAHMAQHMLLVLVAAPSMALSAPLRPFLVALPPWLRHRAGRTWKQRAGLRAISSTLTHPGLAWPLHALMLWLWHAPGLYQAALNSEGIHAIEHAALYVTGLLFWWALLRPNRRTAWLRGPGGSLYVFAMAVQSGVLGALITLAPEPWYTAYAGTTLAWGMSALADQQLAGALMWVAAGVIYLVVALAVLGAWFYFLEHRTNNTSTGRPP